MLLSKLWNMHMQRLLVTKSEFEICATQDKQRTPLISSDGLKECRLANTIEFIENSPEQKKTNNNK